MFKIIIIPLTFFSGQIGLQSKNKMDNNIFGTDAALPHRLPRTQPAPEGGSSGHTV